MRDNFMTVVTGAQGVGKTYKTIEQLENYVTNDPKTGRAGRPVIIFDTNNEFGKYRTIKYDVSSKSDNGFYLSQFQRAEIRRISQWKSNGEMMDFNEKKKTVLDICKQFRDGLILLEDFNTYMINTSQEDIVATLVNLRHRGVDLILHLQSLSAVTPRMFQNTRMIRFHYQTDDVERIKKRVPNFELLKIAQLAVSKQYVSGNTRYYLNVDVRENKIYGISVADYKEAIQEYCNQYKPGYSLANNPSIYLPIKSQ
jgi:hypothetical protein